MKGNKRERGHSVRGSEGRCMQRGGWDSLEGDIGLVWMTERRQPREDLYWGRRKSRDKESNAEMNLGQLRNRKWANMAGAWGLLGRGILQARRNRGWGRGHISRSWWGTSLHVVLRENKVGTSSDQTHTVTEPLRSLWKMGSGRKEGKEGDLLGMNPVTQGRDDGGWD